MVGISSRSGGRSSAQEWLSRQLYWHSGSMRRLLALAVIAVFLAGPTHRLMCLISCDDAAHAGHVAQAGDCHAESGSGPTLSAGTEHCTVDTAPITFTAKRVETKVTGYISLTDDRPALASVDLAGTESAVPVPIGADPPELLIPLRI